MYPEHNCEHTMTTKLVSSYNDYLSLCISVLSGLDPKYLNSHRVHDHT